MLYYKWDWDDGSKSEWVGPFQSDEEANASHIWSKIGKYKIRVKTIDEHRGESEWSEIHTITVLKSIHISNLFDILKKFFENFSILNIINKF